MDIGGKLKAARLEAGLSQRQLCGEIITRNMLSQIENGSAQPSMETLRQLAARLGKSVSWFLEEQTVTSPNLERMQAAREAMEQKNWQRVLDVLESFREPDESFGAEAGLLRYLALVRLGQTALEGGKLPYARKLLVQAGDVDCPYITPESEAGRAVLLSKAGVAAALPGCDGLLLAKAERALSEGDPERCLALLGACENRDEGWNLLCGMARFIRKEYGAAVSHLESAETAYPKETVPKLEEAYRELGDYKKAYEYACKARDLKISV